jgi:hypothetical protein
MRVIPACSAVSRSCPPRPSCTDTAVGKAGWGDVQRGGEKGDIGEYRYLAGEGDGGGGVTQVEPGGIHIAEGGSGRASPPSASWAEKTITTERGRKKVNLWGCLPVWSTLIIRQPLPQTPSQLPRAEIIICHQTHVHCPLSLLHFSLDAPLGGVSKHFLEGYHFFCSPPPLNSNHLCLGGIFVTFHGFLTDKWVRREIIL